MGGSKKVQIFLRKYYQLVTQEVLLNRCSFNHQCIIKAKVKESVFILLFLCIFICIICTHCVCVYFICLYLFTNTWPILDSEGVGALFAAHFLEKSAFCLLTLPKQMPFLTISNKNIFFN